MGDSASPRYPNDFAREGSLDQKSRQNMYDLDIGVNWNHIEDWCTQDISRITSHPHLCAIDGIDWWDIDPSENMPGDNLRPGRLTTASWKLS